MMKLATAQKMSDEKDDAAIRIEVPSQLLSFLTTG